MNGFFFLNSSQKSNKKLQTNLQKISNKISGKDFTFFLGFTFFFLNNEVFFLEKFMGKNYGGKSPVGGGNKFLPFSFHFFASKFGEKNFLEKGTKYIGKGPHPPCPPI